MPTSALASILGGGLSLHLAGLSERMNLKPPSVQLGPLLCVGSAKWHQAHEDLAVLQSGKTLPKGKYGCRIDTGLIDWAIELVRRRCTMGWKGGFAHLRLIDGVAEEMPALLRCDPACSFFDGWAEGGAVIRGEAAGAESERHSRHPRSPPHSALRYLTKENTSTA